MISYRGRHVVVVGGASGMGAAAAASAAADGAKVTILDVRTPEPGNHVFNHCDLRERASIDAAADRVDGPIDALFSCAGVADGDDGIERVNLIGQLHLLDRFLAQSKLPRGAAIAFISSTAGSAWHQHIELLGEVLALDDFDTRQAWMDEHPDLKTYSFTKQAINAYVSRSGGAMAARGLRVNSIMPGPTDTPLARAHYEPWITWGTNYRKAADLPHMVPQDQANGLLFLCSPMAGAINGTTLVIDQGLYGAMATGVYVEPPHPMQ